jgi:predicted dehydrogenase
MATRMQLAVVGTGLAFKGLHLPQLQRLASSVMVTDVLGSSPPRSALAAEDVRNAGLPRPNEHATLAALLDSSATTVLVAVPIHLSFGIIRDCLNAGKHVIAEKPLGDSLSQALELLEVARRQSVHLLVAENFRYQNGFALARQLSEEGKIGGLRGYYLNDLHYTAPSGVWAQTAWRTAGTHRHGYIIDGGPHIVAGLRQMVGHEPTSVSAIGNSFHPDHLGRPWDTLHVNIQFADGVVGHLTLGYGSPDPDGRRPKLLGTDGTLSVGKGAIEIHRLDGSKESIPFAETSGLMEEWDDFAQVLLQGGEPRFSAIEAARDLAFLDASIESAELGVSVPVQSI